MTLICNPAAWSLLVVSLTLTSASASAQKWMTPTPAELSMTSFKEAPGAAAIFLNKNDETDDAVNTHDFYFRVKVLTEKGKDYANIELPFYDGGGGTTISMIAGRTIHPDGTIIEFTGKPYEKLIVKAGGAKVKAKVFTLPSVDVGSILEYQYRTHFDVSYFSEPQWYIQTELYTVQAHYLWRPTRWTLYDESGHVVSGIISWSPILPPGAEVKTSLIVNHDEFKTNGNQFELFVHDIPALANEEDMPPVHSVSYRVQFYNTPYKTNQDFWKAAGRKWSKDVDKFIGSSAKVADFSKSLVAQTDSEDQKARKLYAAVMSMENTGFSREHSTREEKAEGFSGTRSAEETVQRQRGDGDELTRTFVAMARAAGLKAYVMGVADRKERLFLQIYMSMRQIDAEIAVVSIAGRDVYFDPGERYCEAEHLSWRHALTAGVRQTDAGTELGTTPAESYKAAHTVRTADLKLDARGYADGTVTVSYEGDPALRWRQVALTGDDTTLNEALKRVMESALPSGMDVKLEGVENLKDPDKPLKVRYAIGGEVGSTTGKRLLVPADLFEVNEKPRFSAATRSTAVDLHYGSYEQDAVRFTLPEGTAVESMPTASVEKMMSLAAFDVRSVQAANSITSYRNVSLGASVFPPKQYDDLKTFYNKLDTKDQETIVLTRAATTTSAAKDRAL